ncbi:MAG: hypothetical protein GX431_02550 [Bacteroidales bacterium]|nr:hypothetical protein [Bacteroidales bacterium]
MNYSELRREYIYLDSKFLRFVCLRDKNDMKTITLIQAILFIQFFFLSEQTIPPKANTIIITDSLTMNQYYLKVTDILFESGYGKLSTDIENGTITTTEKAFKNGVVKLVILVKDNKVLLRGNSSEKKGNKKNATN